MNALKKQERISFHTSETFALAKTEQNINASASVSLVPQQVNFKKIVSEFTRPKDYIYQISINLPF
ncbi:hypothetical protein BTO15_08635 [Polaribacter sejongensis]|uniref:Uncharacterized protein n=1 Tax=Polaribacter sejongensis TaxID=985043 RepID=A0ABN5F414_9FLAO|nr:hypothetical protein BTO15_08635 [Polaribacter sejongensis]